MQSRNSGDGPALVDSPGLVYAILVIGMAAALVTLAIVDRLGIAHAHLVAWPFVLTLVVAFLSRVRRACDFLADGGAVAAGLNAPAMAAAALSATLLLGSVGGHYALGHDGLTAATAAVAAFLLLALLLAPYVRRSGCQTPADFLGARYGAAVRIATAVASAVLVVTLLAAEIALVGRVGAVAGGFGTTIDVAIATGVVLVAVLIGGMRAATWAGATLYLFLLAAVTAAAALLAWRHAGNPFAPLAFGGALREISDLEFTMLGKKLADGASLKRHGAPFLTLDMLNTAGILLGVMAGLAAMPHVLSRSFAARSPAAARSSAASAMVLVLLVMSALPALAAYGKMDIYRMLAAGTRLDALPGWLYEYGRLGIVKVCGGDAVSAEAVAAACKTVGGHKGLLRLHDLAIVPEAFLLALPNITGLPRLIGSLVAAGAAAAFLASAVSLLAAVAGTLGNDILRGAKTGDDAGARIITAARIIALLLAVGAAGLALGITVEIEAVATWVLPLAATVLFPPLVLAVWMRRASGAGVLAGMLAGGGVVLYYLVATRYWAPAFYDTWPSLSNAGASAIAKYQGLKAGLATAGDGGKGAAAVALEAQARLIANWWGVKPAAAGLIGLAVAFPVAILASLMTPRPGPERQAFIDRIRRPNLPDAGAAETGALEASTSS